MTSPPPTTIPSPLAAISLKLVGAITILAALIDFITLLFPPEFGDRAWQLATTTQLVDRGIVPLVGIALLFTGYWIDSSLGNAPRRVSLATDPRFWVCLLACLLGLVFLLTAVLHPNNVRLQSRDAIAQVEAEAQQASSELEGRLNADISQRRAQIDALLQDEDQLQAAIASDNLDEAQRAQIEQFRDDPEALNEFLNSQVGEAQTQLQTRIGEQKQDATKRLRSEALKATIRVTLSSLLLAVGYTFIGWAGLRRLLSIVS
ncbi:HpsJ family protein [Leptolyngbya sp. BC1307]|uniref:hormogonium polysaccharide biosynthesis protein HpsJ n=1 Tax=Leptolyngbya sp. BC1307 TaxID=2029589 RepID=UPI000EFCD67F|nr:HpsJ family protein [Leptolyngbya sp. BC1307]